MAGTETQALTVAAAGQMEVIPGYGSVKGFELLQRGAQALAASSMVPDRLRRKCRELHRGARNVVADAGVAPHGDAELARDPR